MAGSPLKRARIAAAKQEAGDATARLDAMRAALLAAGLDPNDYDDDQDATAGDMLAEYNQALPREVYRLAKLGQSPAEIRVQLGFTELQENDWRNRYVELDAAIVRARDLHRAFWDGQARIAAQTGDTSTFRSVTTLIEKTFLTTGGRGNAANLVVVKSIPKRQASAPVMVAAE